MKALYLSTVRRWYAVFHRGRVSLHGGIRKSRPSNAITEVNVITVDLRQTLCRAWWTSEYIGL